MAHRVLGLDIGARRIKGSIIESSLRKQTLVFHAGLDVPMARPVRPREPDAAEPQGRKLFGEEVLSSLRGFLDSTGATFDEVAVALPAEAVIWRSIELPFVKRSKIEQVVPFEVEGDLPYELDDLILASTVIHSDQNNSLVGVNLARKETIAALIAGLNSIGIDPRVIAPPHWALIRSAAQSVEGSTGLELALDMGARSTMLVLFENGRPRSLRTLGRGGDAITEHLAKSLGLSFEEAEKGKIEEVDLSPGASGETRARIRDLTIQGLDPWLVEIRQTILALTGERGVERIWACGGGSLLRGFDQWLSEELGITVARFDPFASVSDREVSPDEAERAGAAVSIGLALMGSASRSNAVDFRRGPFIHRRASQQLAGRARPMIAMASILLLLFIGNLYMGYSASHSKSQEVLQRLQTIWRQSFPGEPIPKDIKPAFEERIKKDMDKLHLIGELGDGSLTLVEVLYQMSESIPAKGLTVDFKKMEVAPDVIRIEGEAGSYEDVAKVEAALREMPWAASIKQENVGKTPDEKNVKFKLIISLVTR